MTNSVLAAVAAAAGADVRLADLTNPPAPAPATPAPAVAPAATGLAAGVNLADALEAARREERARLMALDALAVPGCEAILSAAKDNGTAPGVAAIEILTSLKAAGRLDAIAALQAASAKVPEVPTVAHDPVGGSTGLSALPEGPDRWKAEYAALPDKFRGDYPTEASFLASRKRGEPAPK